MAGNTFNPGYAALYPTLDPLKPVTELRDLITDASGADQLIVTLMGLPSSCRQQKTISLDRALQLRKVPATYIEPASPWR